MLTLAWRLFPLTPVLHHHCSCSQNWHHSPEMIQRAAIRLSNGNNKDILVTQREILFLRACWLSIQQSSQRFKWQQFLCHISLSMDEFCWLFTNSMGSSGMAELKPSMWKRAVHISAHGPTCRSMSPGSIRPSAATAPPFIIEPMYMPPSPRSLLCPTMLIPRKLYFSIQGQSGG